MIYETNFHEWIKAESRWQAVLKSKYPFEHVLIVGRKNV